MHLFCTLLTRLKPFLCNQSDFLAFSGRVLDIELPHTPPPRSPPPIFSPRRLANIAAAEQRGAELIASVYASGHVPDLTLDDDDWEDVSEVEESSDEGSPSPPARSAIPHSGETASAAPAVFSQRRPSQSPGRQSQTLPSLPSPVPAVDTQAPDPFRRSPYKPCPIPTPDDVHPQPAVYLIYLTVLWLHTQCKLSFRACNTLLVIMSVILSTAAVTIDPPLCTTLATIMSQLHADAQFQELPVCISCLKPFPATSPGESVCDVCGTPLYNTQLTVVQQRGGRTTRARPKPFLRSPYKSLEEQLIELVPEIEAVVDSWRTKLRTAGKYTDHFDGDVCKTLEGPDGLPFFRPDLRELPDGELRIGVTLGVDWFSYRRSLISASYSLCLMSFSVINLLPSLRYMCK